MKITPKTTKTPKRKPKGYKWPSRIETFRIFSSWMAYPPSIRDPKTQKEFAKMHEISPDSLSDYKKKPEFWELVEEKKEKIRSDIEDSRLLEKAFLA